MTADSYYTQVGGELSIPQSIANKQAAVSTASLFLNDSKILLKAYNIDGNNYFKLRDLGDALDFNVDWNQELQTINIDTSLSNVSE